MTSTDAQKTVEQERVKEVHWKKWAWHLIALLFFAWVFGITTNFSLNDPDLWWHLRTGQTTLETRALPSQDLFSFTSPPNLPHEQIEGLRAHWLGQVILYLAYKTGGYAGLGFFRGLLIILPGVLIYLWLVRRGVKPWMALATSSLGALMLAVELFYSFERPQGISFLLSLLAIMLLEEVKRGKKIMALLLVLLMVFWANVHAGFIVGVVIILLYICGEAAAWVYRGLRGASWKPDYLFFGGAAVAVLATGLNPNGYSLSYNYLHGLAAGFLTELKHSAGLGGGGGWVENVVLEYRPLTYFYSELLYRWIMFYWVFSGVLLVLLLVKYWLRKKIDLTELFTVCFVSFFANHYARGLMFSVIILSFYYGKSILELKDLDLKKPSGVNVPRLARSFFAALMVAGTVWFTLYVSPTYGWALNPGITKQWVSPWYPLRADKFLKETGIKPPMYNFYTWGGFLIWDLYPRYKVFIDGRALSNSVSTTADAILKSYPGWQQQLDSYHINFVLVPVIFRESGYIIPIAVSMINDREWQLVFLGDNSAIFVRNDPENREIIRRYGMDKRAVLDEIVNIENVLLYTDPGNPIYNINKADALEAMGNRQAAGQIYGMYPDWVRQKFSTLFVYYPGPSVEK